MDNVLTNKLLDLLSAEFGIDITKPTRQRAYVDARKIYARILTDKGWSLNRIGRTIGKHHSTIIHYLKDIEWLIEHDASIRTIYLNVSSVFNEHLEYDPIHTKTREELLLHIYKLEDEKKLLISAIKTLDENRKREYKFKELFEMVSNRLPLEKLEEFESKVNRILNGI